MYDHADLAALQAAAQRMQGWIRRQTFAPGADKALRRFSEWEAAELILKTGPAALREARAADPGFPRGEAETAGGQRWHDLAALGEMRRRLAARGHSTLPYRPEGARALRTAIANFKGGAGKSTLALHYAHAAALAGYRVLMVDFDPQATLSHAMGLVEVDEERTVWGIMARDLTRETERMNAGPVGALSGAAAPRRPLPASIRDLGVGDLDPAAFIRPTAWATIDMVPSCANAAFVEFATAQYRHLNPEWSFFAAVARWLDALADDAYDLVFFDCPPAIGYQAMNAVFAADLLVIPTGPGYWEYDSTSSFVGQLSDALADLAAGFGPGAFPAGKSGLPKAFRDLRVVLTRYEPGNELHRAMLDAYGRSFGARLAAHPVEMTRAVEQSGRFLCSVYESDYRDMTRETWRRARASFDRAWAEFASWAHPAWAAMAEEARPEPARARA